MAERSNGEDMRVGHDKDEDDDDEEEEEERMGGAPRAPLFSSFSSSSCVIVIQLDFLRLPAFSSLVEVHESGDVRRHVFLR